MQSEDSWIFPRREYRRRLAGAGFRVRTFQAEDPDCGGHTVWLATDDADAADGGSQRFQYCLFARSRAR